MSCLRVGRVVNKFCARYRRGKPDDATTTTHAEDAWGNVARPQYFYDMLAVCCRDSYYLGGKPSHRFLSCFVSNTCDSKQTFRFAVPTLLLIPWVRHKVQFVLASLGYRPRRPICQRVQCTVVHTHCCREKATSKQDDPLLCSNVPSGRISMSKWVHPP